MMNSKPDISNQVFIQTFDEKKIELLDGKSNLDQYHAQQCVATTPVPTTTATSSVAAIIAAAEEVKTDTEKRITELEAILASLDPDLDADLIGSLNTLLSFFNLLTGNLNQIATVSETNQRIKRGEMGELTRKVHHLFMVMVGLVFQQQESVKI